MLDRLQQHVADLAQIQRRATGGLGKQGTTTISDRQFLRLNKLAGQPVDPGKVPSVVELELEDVQQLRQRAVDAEVHRLLGASAIEWPTPPADAVAERQPQDDNLAGADTVADRL